MWKITKFFNSLLGIKQAGAKAKQHLPVVKPPSGGQAYPQKQDQTHSPKRNVPYQGENLLRELTKSPIWNWDCFRAVLIYLAQIGHGHYLPGSLRPNSVFLDGLQTTFGELRQISGQWQGRETSRVVLVDTGKSCLVISGKTHIGNLNKVKIDMTPEPGRNLNQLPVLTIHVHPGKDNDPGLSDQDYISFLSQRSLIIMMICYQGGNLFAMKTSSTHAAIASDTTRHMISVIRNDIRSTWSKMSLPKSILAFNKAVCMEFGLTLYQTGDPKENVARRVEVTVI